MKINENITVNLTPEDVTKIIENHLNENGYVVQGLSFDIKEKCEGWYQSEHYVKYFAGVNCKVIRKEE